MKTINQKQLNNLIKALNTSTPFSRVKGILDKIDSKPVAVVPAHQPRTIQKMKHISPKK